jgi:GIY-YIG catalytic domain
MESPQRPALIYALTDPESDEVRYIGRTRHLMRRYARHLLKRRGAPDKVRWLQELEQKRRLPGVVVLEEVAPEDVEARERWWIAHYRQRGAQLLNRKAREGERWNIYMPRWLRQIVEQEAAAARLSPSQLLQDVGRAAAAG